MSVYSNCFFYAKYYNLHDSTMVSEALFDISIKVKLVTLCLLVRAKLMSSADRNLCKQFGSRAGPTKCWACSELNVVYTLKGF